MRVLFDLKFEEMLIKDDAKEIYEEFLKHAERRSLESEYVVNEFLRELQCLARKDGYIK